MAREQIETTLTDSDGVDHAYQLTQYRAGDGFNILARLVRVVGQGGGEVVAALGIGEGGASVGSVLDLDLGSLDMSKLGGAFSVVAGRIISEGGDAFAKEILKGTMRQSADGTWEKCGARFDSIYQDNYAELFAALFWAL